MGEPGKPLRIVVFGGIGSGKSTFAALLAELGAVVVEADRVGHEILEPGGAAHQAVAASWPGVVVHGEIDRGRLASIVFADPVELEKLEAISHPLIGSEIQTRAADAGDRPVVVELPLMGRMLGDEWTWVLVDAPAEIRLERAVARGGGRADVRARMAAQPDEDEWHEQADWTIPNTGSIEDLKQAAAELWAQLSQS